MTAAGEARAPGTVVSRGTLVVDVEACKGCELCIAACPPGVLRMTAEVVNERGYRYPELLPGCTGCRACAAICPDFVFQVYKFDTPVVHASAGSGRPTGGAAAASPEEVGP